LTLFCPLASGSKGNAVFIKTPKANLLVDAGISAKLIKERLESLHVCLSSINAILISHEHHDHISGLKTLSLRYNIPIIANASTAESIVEDLGECPKFHIFTTGEPFEFFGLEILPFTIQHDGLDPVAFTIKTPQGKIGLCTDIGFITNTVRHNLEKSNILYIEANHEQTMVHASNRPDIYKRRVLSRTGHLSNIEAAQLIADLAHPNLQHVYLAHLSSECNSHDTALRIVSTFLKEKAIHVPISIAFQNEMSIPTHIPAPLQSQHFGQSERSLNSTIKNGSILEYEPVFDRSNP
jgi:phosphoribosyl 1,2-cyclic phosphodiesterase